MDNNATGALGSPLPPIRCVIPPAYQFLFKKARYKVAYGGRGAAKSQSIARALLMIGRQEYKRILCGREFQNSIEESVHFLLKSQIDKLGMSDEWRTTENHIIHKWTGTNFSFKGIRNNIDSIKSFEDVDIFWGEEAQKFSENSFKILIPTIRKAGSELWFSWNTGDETDPIYKRFVASAPPDSIVRLINYDQNPFFTPELELERAYLERTDYESYCNIWLGQPRRRSNAQILHDKYTVEEFDDDALQAAGNDPMYGADWGFAKDPTTLVRCFLVGATLYISHELYQVGLELNHTADAFRGVKGGGTYPIRADSARPETISYLHKHHGLNIDGVEKWPGSVEEGITFLRALERIVIHPRCKHTIEEARLWSYKIHKQTDDVLPEVLDGNDHMWDAIRYALQPVIRTSKQYDGMIAYLAGLVEDQKKAQQQKQEG